MIENVKKLFSYNWSEVFSKLKGNDNAIEVPEGVVKSIKSGFHLSIIYIAIIAAVPVLAMLFASIFFVGRDSIGAILAVFVTAVVVIAIAIVIVLLLLNFLIKGKARTALRYVVVLVLIAIGVVFTCFSFLGSFRTLGSDVIGFVLNLIALAVSFIAYANVAVGCIDFCLEANK